MVSTPANPGRRVTFHDATRPATTPRPAHRPPAHRFAARQKPIITISPLPPLLTLSTSGLVADPTANPTTDPTECSPMAGNRTSWLTYIYIPPADRRATTACSPTEPSLSFGDDEDSLEYFDDHPSIRYDAFQYDTILYDSIRLYSILYDFILHCAIRYDTVRSITLLYGPIRHCSIQYGDCTIPYDIVRYCAILYDTARFGAILYALIRRLLSDSFS